MEVKLEEIVKGLVQDRGRYWEPEEVEEYLRKHKIEIDKNMITILLERLVEDDIWRWLKYIGNKLPGVASTEERFMALLEEIASKVKGDMAQGPFIRALIDIGSKDPELGFALYKAMLKKDLIEYGGLTLGGAGKVDFEKAFELIRKGIESYDPNLKTTCIKALRVIFENEEELKKASEIFQILDKGTDEKEDVIVRKEVANAYIDFSRFDPDKCTSRLVKLAEKDNSDIRYNLATRLEIQNLARSEDEIRILKICSQDNDESVLWRVSTALSFKGKEYPEESLEIIKSWVEQGKYLKVRDVEYCLREIGKVHLDRCIKVIEDWIGKEKDKRLHFFIPDILKEMSSSNYGLLIESVKVWTQGETIFQKMALKTTGAVLTEIFPPKTEHQSLVETCFSILELMAKEKGLDVRTIIRGEQEKLFQCFRIIEELELGRPELDFDEIYANLENYPIVKEFLGDRWFQRKKRENNRIHPLLILLSYETPSKEKIQSEMDKLRKETDVWLQYLKSLRIEDLLRPTAFLNHLEEMLGIIASKSKKLRDLRDGLGNEDQFWQTFSEIEVVSSFMRRYPVEIAPEIDGMKLDAKIEIDREELLVEVINPEMFKPLRYLTGKAIRIENRARKKIYDEFKNHLKGVQIKENTPIIIVIDVGRSEIDYEFVEDYLMGTQQLVMLFNRKRAEVIKTYPARAKDFMYALEEKTDILSVVLCYRRLFGKDNKFHFEGRIIPNKYAKNPLNLELIEKIEETLFRK